MLAAPAGAARKELGGKIKQRDEIPRNNFFGNEAVRHNEVMYKNKFLFQFFAQNIPLRGIEAIFYSLAEHKDGDIERDLYLTKKDVLLRQKAKLEESLGAFGQQGKNRLEPLRSFVLSLKEAEKVTQTKNYAEWRNFFRSVGSNPEIKDKTLSINWGELWDFTAKTKADFALRSAAYSPRGAVNSEQVSFGAVFLN